jgi:hypothetical protein
VLAREWRRRGVQDVLREELRWREDSEERRRGCCGIRKEYVDDESLAVHVVARQKRLFKLDRRWQLRDVRRAAWPRDHWGGWAPSWKR